VLNRRHFCSWPAGTGGLGALAIHIAEAARRRHPASVVPDAVAPYFSEMAQVAVGMSHIVGDVLLTHDPVDARRLHDDDTMDELHHRLTAVLDDSSWPHGVAAAIDVALLARFYERFADHAVLIGRRIVFQVTGELPQLTT
jgi:phosphate transport system protein